MTEALNDLVNDWYKRDLGYLIAQGRVYNTFVSSESIAAGESLYMVIVAGSEVSALHTLTMISTSTQVIFTIFRAPSYTGGSPLPKVNLNDIVGITGNENVTALNSTVVVSDPGDLVFGPWDIFSTNNVTIDRDITGPLILQPNQTYLIMIENPSGAPAEMSLNLSYIDH
jgi:hypothetical protein